MIKGVILDLDGTIYRGSTEVPGAANFVKLLHKKEIKPLFVTNRASRTTGEVQSQLELMGIPCKQEDVFTSAQATAQYINKGSVFFIGEDGLREEIEKAGLIITDKAPDYVVVSFDRLFNYDKLKKASLLIRAGAKFIGTNPDRGLPTEEGITPGSGAILAAVIAATGVEPFIIGKPQPLIIEYGLRCLGMDKSEVINVGDNVETDVPAGMRAGVRTALILTGFSTRADADKAPVKPTWIVENYNELTAIIEDNP